MPSAAAHLRRCLSRHSHRCSLLPLVTRPLSVVPRLLPVLPSQLRPGGRSVVPASPWSRCSSVHSGDFAQRSAICCSQQAASHLTAPRVIRLLSRSALLPGQRTPSPCAAAPAAQLLSHCSSASAQRCCFCSPAQWLLLLRPRPALLPLRPRPAAAAPAVRPSSTVLSPRPSTAPGRQLSAPSLRFPCSSS
jgi:hypothetical protein